MKLSVVIVNYNVKYYLAQCIESLLQATTDIDTEVIVVDNASSDDSQSLIERDFPQVHYIYNKENLGFARANNVAIRQAQGEYVLVLNPDTLLPEDNVKKVLQFMDNHPDAGACGVHMLAPDGTFLPESKRGYPSPLTSFWKLLGMHKLFPGNPRFDGYYLSWLDEYEVHPVPVLAGAYMMLRNEMLKKVGLLDESFFMYGEDIDWSCRIEESGYKNYYLPYSMLHYKGESTSKNTYKYIRVFYGAMDIFFCKHGASYPWIYRTFIRLAIKLQTWVKLALLYFKKKMACLCKTEKIEPKFLVFTSEKNEQAIKNLVKKNLLQADIKLVSCLPVDNNLSDFKVENNLAYTSIVYDASIFSYTSIIKLIELNAETKTMVGIYQGNYKALIIPEKIYLG